MKQTEISRRGGSLGSPDLAQRTTSKAVEDATLSSLARAFRALRREAHLLDLARATRRKAEAELRNAYAGLTCILGGVEVAGTDDEEAAA